MYGRYRTRGSVITQRHTNEFYGYYNTDACSGAQKLENTDKHAKTGDYVTMNDFVTPNFHRRKAKGEIIMSPMDRTHEIQETVTGSGVDRQQTTSHDCGGTPRYTRQSSKYWQGTYAYLAANGGGSAWPGPYHIIPRSLLNDSDISNLIVEKSTEVLNAIGRSDHDVWESVAEVNKTVTLLPGLIKSLRKAIPVGRKADLKKSISEVWLAYRYGITPLLQDIEGVVKGLEKKVGLVRKTHRSSGSILANEVKSHVWNPGVFVMTVLSTSQDKVTVRCTSITEYEASVAFNIGFSPKGLITLPWELIRYSFVIDWFANVGNFLGALVPSPHVKQLGSCVSIFREKNMVLSQASVTAGPGWQILSAGGGSHRSYVGNYSRSAGIPAPGLVIKSDFRFDNITRAADSIALLIGRLTGRSR